MQPEHANDPQVWFREGLCASLSVLVTAFRADLITATIRLGVRDRNHPHGYFEGQIVTLRVLDGEHDVMEPRLVRITSVKSKPLGQLTREDLKKTVIYSEDGWTAVQRDLSIFYRYHVDADEMMSIVEFEYVTNDEAAVDRLRHKEQYPGLFFIYND